jgi:hypothetical protein
MGDGSGCDVPRWVIAAQEAREAVEAGLRRRDVAPRVRERLEMVKGVALGGSPVSVNGLKYTT